MKIDKPPVCHKLLQNGKKYRLVCEPGADITPEVRMFKTILEQQGRIVLRYVMF